MLRLVRMAMAQSQLSIGCRSEDLQRGMICQHPAANFKKQTARPNLAAMDELEYPIGCKPGAMQPGLIP